MIIEAQGKINIGLAVGKRRNDGFHPIRSYFARISLCDYIDVEVSGSDTFSCTISSDIEYLDNNKTDIMEKCARAFSNSTGLSFATDIRITKRIPFKAGFGGGSSDGAAIIEYLNTCFGNPLDRESLFSLGLSCGSDIPFFLSGVSLAYIEGRGEVIESVDVPKGLSHVLLFMPDETVSTSAAYSKLDSIDYPFPTLPKIIYPLNKVDFPNDFERAIESPLLRELENIYKDKAFVSLSGSGSGCYVLSDDDNIDELERLAPREYIKARIV